MTESHGFSNGDVKVGDKVCHSRKFLKSAGVHSGPVPFARGIVKEIIDYGQGWRVAVIDWGLDDELYTRTNVANLSIVDPEKGILEEV
jgi:hypothetical protein